jgi:transposase
MNSLMWTATTRAQHKRDGLRFASDVTDAEWALIEPLLPSPSPVGRPPEWPMREIVNAIFYILRGGIPWRMLPPCFPPHQTVYGWFSAWRDAGVWQSINHHLVMQIASGSDVRPARPRRSLTAKVSRRRKPAARGYDAGKKVLGRKRHAMVDTDGRPLVLQVHPASLQDRDGAISLLKASRRSFPFVERAFADSAYAAQRVADATLIAIEIVRTPADQVGFAVHPRRWVVERCLAWLGRNRRLAKDFEATVASATAFLYAASAMLLLRRIARSA